MQLTNIFLLCVVSGVSILPLVFLNSQSENSQLFLGKYEIPKRPRAPININSEKVEEENTSTPLSLHASLSDEVIVVNTGKIVEVILAQQKTTTGITGGILKEDKYIFRGIKYLWTDDINGIASSTIDNKGYPLENEVIFYNQKYTTYENALNYPDGFVLVNFFIGICPNQNEKFGGYSEILRRIQKPGSVVKTTLGTSIIWVAGKDVMPKEGVYYAYPGSYIDEKTGKRYYCSTVILMPHSPKWCLSKEQFEETFGSFKNFWGRNLTNTKSRFPQNMPVVRAKGLLNSYTL